jgi:hypothetical protein
MQALFQGSPPAHTRTSISLSDGKSFQFYFLLTETLTLGSYYI